MILMLIFLDDPVQRFLDALKMKQHGTAGSVFILCHDCVIYPDMLLVKLLECHLFGIKRNPADITHLFRH
ncbi:Uncharacterised protein [Chlamydia trachomatis]|nr:Uncharacterised protein [Chlamydia trachomatis]